MVESYFLSKDGDTASKLEDGCFTLPANRNYSTIFNVNNATGNRNISGPIFSEAYVHVHIHVGYSFTGVVASFPGSPSSVHIILHMTFDLPERNEGGAWSKTSCK